MEVLDLLADLAVAVGLAFLASALVARGKNKVGLSWLFERQALRREKLTKVAPLRRQLDGAFQEPDGLAVIARRGARLGGAGQGLGALG